MVGELSRRRETVHQDNGSPQAVSPSVSPPLLVCVPLRQRPLLPRPLLLRQLSAAKAAAQRPLPRPQRAAWVECSARRRRPHAPAPPRRCWPISGPTPWTTRAPPSSPSARASRSRWWTAVRARSGGTRRTQRASAASCPRSSCWSTGSGAALAAPPSPTTRLSVDGRGSASGRTRSAAAPETRRRARRRQRSHPSHSPLLPAAWGRRAEVARVGR